jgi:hypothetical protein
MISIVKYAKNIFMTGYREMAVLSLGYMISMVKYAENILMVGYRW